MSRTQEALAQAFAGESQANRKYLAFAAQAESEGYPQVAKLFRAAAEAETVHALSHLRAMEGIKTTKENLEAAINGETYEFETMYPPMIESARQEGNKKAEKSFTRANTVEQTHASLYKKALEALGSNPDTDYHVCQICGHTTEGPEAPDSCEVCGATKDKFKKID